MRVFGILAVVEAVCASVVPPLISRILAHRFSPRRVTELNGLKEQLHILAGRHVTDNLRIKHSEEATWERGSLPSAYYVLSQLPVFPKMGSSSLLVQQLQQGYLRLLTDRVNRSSPANEMVRPRIKREDRGVLYLPVRGAGGGAAACPSYVDTVSASLTQMAFASVAVTVFNTVFNIVNNINNNNNNNNANNNNNVASNNANAASNNNNGNQVDVVLPPPVGRRRRHNHADVWTLKPPPAIKTTVDVSHTMDSHPLINRSIEGVDGCLPPKTYARAALATLLTLQDILHSPVVVVRK